MGFVTTQLMGGLIISKGVRLFIESPPFKLTTEMQRRGREILILDDILQKMRRDVARIKTFSSQSEYVDRTFSSDTKSLKLFVDKAAIGRSWMSSIAAEGLIVRRKISGRFECRSSESGPV